MKLKLRTVPAGPLERFYPLAKREREKEIIELTDPTENTMASPKITLYFDIVSPFAYIAFHVLRVSRFSKTEVLDSHQY